MRCRMITCILALVTLIPAVAEGAEGPGAAVAATDSPPAVAPVAPSSEGVLSVIVQVEALPSEEADEAAQYWAAKVIMHNDDGSAAGSSGPQSGQRLLLRTQVPNATLGKPGDLSQVVIRAVEGAIDPALWEVIGLPEAIVQPDPDGITALPDPNRFADNLASMLKGSADVQPSAEGTELTPVAEVAADAELDHPESEPEEEGPTDQPAPTKTPAEEPATTQEAGTTPAVGPSLPPQPVKSSAWVLGGDETMLIEYAGPLRPGAAFATSAEQADSSGHILVLEVDGRFLP